MPLIERLLRTVPYVRRAYIERDAALAKLRAAEAIGLGDPATSPIETQAGRVFRQPCWFLLSGEDAGQDRQIGDFRAFIAKAIGKSAQALEIGPSLNPILPKREGYRVDIVDHADQAELIRKYSVYGLDISKIERVDIVCSGASMAEAIGAKRYNSIVAAHVVEHAPDLIQFLKDCSSVLDDGGSIYLLIPDRRYSFDFMQPLSDVAKILADHRAKRAHHSFESFYRHSAHVYNGELMAWDQCGIAQPRFPHGDPNLIRSEAEHNVAAPAYIAAHENYFTPVSFAMIVEELSYLREFDLDLTVLTRSRGCEFLAVLRKASRSALSSEAFLQRKMDGNRLLLLEERERIISASSFLARPS